MTWVSAAVIGGSALLGAGSSYLGSKQQAKGAERSQDINMEMFRQLNAQQQPFMQSGYGAMGRLNTLLGLNPNPSYRSPTASSSPGFMPTPGGGVQPIMQGGSGPRMYAGGPRGDPRAGNARLNQLLAMRAANGDRQAQAMLERLG